MSTLSDLQKKLQQESEGIMFPFRTATVSTTQPVLDTATDGIMSITGQKYIGPDSVIQYSPEGQRQLKEIEKGMLPQFDQSQFPDIGKGKVEDRGGAVPLPVDTTPLPQPEAPAIDPCPPGFKYDPVKKICVPVEQPKGDKPSEVKPPRVPNKFESSLNGYLRHEEIKQAIDGSNYDVTLNPERLQGRINIQESTSIIGDKEEQNRPITGDVVRPLQEGGTAGFLAGTQGSDPMLGVTNEQKTFSIDVTEEMNTANIDAAIGSILGSVFGGPAMGATIGGLIRKNYGNTLIGQLNGLVDFGILEKPVDGFKIDTEGGVLGVGGKSSINNITTTNVAKNKIRQLISQATPEYNKEVRQQLGKEYLDKTKDYQKALFSAGNRSLMEGVSDAERRQLRELDKRAGVTRTAQGGFGGFEAKTKDERDEARKRAEKVADQLRKEREEKRKAGSAGKFVPVDDDWKNDYNWSGPNNTGEMLSEKKKEDRGSGSGTGESRVICTELHSTKELSTKDWIRDTQFTFKHLSKTHVKGYLAWAIPTVKHIQKYKLYRKVWKHIAQHRANDIAWRMKQGKFDLLGRIYAGIGEPLCWVIGNFVSDYNLNKLGVNRQWQK